MRISELLESEQLDEISRPNSISTAVSFLEKTGWTPLAAGSYARVLTNPKYPYVLKLFHSSDKGYPYFVETVRTHKNIHFPVFRGNMIRISAQYYAIRMEKLTHSYKYGYREIAKTVEDYIIQNPSTRGEKIMELEKTQPGLIRACDILHDVAVERDLNVDVHSHNIMLRGNVLVITDPFS